MALLLGSFSASSSGELVSIVHFCRRRRRRRITRRMILTEDG
jgi:hypothetical protein